MRRDLDSSSSSAAHRDRSRAPRAGHRARRARRGQRAAPTRSSARSSSRTSGSSARAGTTSTAARTRRSTRSPPPATPTCAARRCTSRSSPAATRASSRRAPTRSSRPASARVVVASDDPTEKASGRGLGILRDEGVEVDLAGGELAARARLQNQAFRKHARTGRPWVLFKSAMSLDGKVATQTGDSKWISSEDSRAASRTAGAPSCDAVAVGIGTALADDPQLTARIDGVRHQPRRVVFDSDRRACRWTPSSSRPRHEVPLVVVVSRAARALDTDALENAGRRGHRRHRRERARARALGARPARRARPAGHLGPARGRPAPGRRLPRRRRDRRAAPLHRAAAARRALGARPARGRGRRRDLRRAARADARVRARSRATSCSRRACGSGERLFTGLVADLGTVAAVALHQRRRAPGHRVAAGARAVRGRLGRRQRRLPDGRRPVRRPLRRRRDARDAAPLLAGRGAHAATRVNLELRAAPPTRASAATSSRATSTASAPSSAVREDGFARVVTIEAEPDAAALRGREGLDRRRRRLAHRRAHRRRRRSTSR